MSDCIDTIASLTPASSRFANSDVREIFDETIGKYFDEKEIDIEDLIEAPFLTEASGFYLDYIHGRLYGIERLPDEDDEDYRARLIFHCKEGVQLKDLQELGCKVYLHFEDFDEDTTLTSRRITGFNNKLVIDCPSDAIEELIKDNYIWEKALVFI